MERYSSYSRNLGSGIRPLHIITPVVENILFIHNHSGTRKSPPPPVYLGFVQLAYFSVTAASKTRVLRRYAFAQGVRVQLQYIPFPAQCVVACSRGICDFDILYHTQQ